ncbi:MAG: DNA cytosine methyltransferase [Pseudomonadota bacterium]|nr:DNA cytosine methyltransferase [Pseudomonadota bacterium]
MNSYSGLLPHEISVDNFAGGGGASTGIEAGLNRPVDIAINHNPKALAMHRINHPKTEHYCESVWNVNPVEATKNQPVGLVWLSPDCRHFSKAKGGKPVSRNIRGLAWVAIRWLVACRPRVLMLENVEEFMQWGPLLHAVNGKQLPCPERKGQTFDGFIKAISTGLPAGSPIFKDMHPEIFKYNYDIKEKLRIYKLLRAGLGYNVEHKVLAGCDYGAPTIRKRFFMVARCDGIKIGWPKKTHGDPNSHQVKKGKLKPYRSAAECIDWSIDTPSIFERKIPLVEKSQQRIAAGIMRYVVNNPAPYAINIKKTIAKTPKGQLELLSKKKPKEQLVSAFIAKNYTGVVGSSIEEPLHTITSIDHNSLVTAFLSVYYGNEKDGQAIDQPIRTIVSKDRFGLVKVESDNYEITDIGYRMLQPRELFTAQGFRKDYIIDRGIDEHGNEIKLSKKDQTAMVGNSVCPDLAEALVKSNFKHEESFKLAV